ncbi:MAG: mannosyltransferase family protein [Coleofasciculaceae cyanobacterium]
MSSNLKLPVDFLRSKTTPQNQLFQELSFIFLMWFLSRVVIIVTMQLIAPYYPTFPVVHPIPGPLDFVPGFVPKPSWDLFTHWDAAWFLDIATNGYEYLPDEKMHNVAFFPLLPLAMRGLMTLGIPVQVAGFLINNTAFFGALILLYRWTEENHGVSAARWATAIMAWCPFSLYGTVVYSEGMFMLLTTASLRSFEKGQYKRAALWGALTTATRVTGASLIPTFLLVSWREKRPLIAYIAALATGLGLLSFMIFCAIKFNDPLAFVHVQKGWGIEAGINWSGWVEMFTTIFTWQHSALKELTKVVMFFGGGYLLWYLRRELSRTTLFYGVCSLALIFNSGAMWSINRYAYAIVSLWVAFGLLLSRNRRWGYAVLGLCGIVLFDFSIRFAWWRWIS